MKGEGDHTWIETIFMEHDDFHRYEEQNKKLKRMTSKNSKPEYQDYDEDNSADNTDI
jgi:hypothetical protein